MGNTEPLQLQPNGLYILVSLARPDYPSPITEDTIAMTIEETLATGDQFEWGLYWCSSGGIGQSRRYRERKGVWRLQSTWYPNTSRKELPSIEDDARIIIAVHIADIEKPMNDRLSEDLKPTMFSHSQSSFAQGTRPVSKQRRTSLTGAFVEPDDGRSRKWLGHVLYMMSRQGYISLKENERSIGVIERETTKTARANLAAGVRSVEECAHADMRASQAIFKTRALGDFLEDEDKDAAAVALGVEAPKGKENEELEEEVK